MTMHPESQVPHHYIIGGGTVSHVRSHLALSAPAYGSIARYIYQQLKAQNEQEKLHKFKLSLHLTKMADFNSDIETPEDLKALIEKIVKDENAAVVFFSPNIVDFTGAIDEVTSGKYANRLKSREVNDTAIRLTPRDKIINAIRAERKDIYLVGFKTTTGADAAEQYAAGLRLVKEGHVNLVLANDTITRNNMVIVPEEARYYETGNRNEALDGLIKIALNRSNLTFTRSTVLEDEPRINWNSPDIPHNLRALVDYLIKRGAYKPFLGNTAGHFAVRGKLQDEFLTSARRENFKDLPEKGLVRVFAKGADEVVAHGAKPSVGGQSQRAVFASHPDLDCIVHFHAPFRHPTSDVPVRPQWMYECGSHECGQNTAEGLREMMPGIHAVMLENHGPNIVFSRDVPVQRLIEFIESRWDLDNKTGGIIPPAYQVAASAPAPV